MTTHSEDHVQLIPMRQISVLNPRDRPRKKFLQITDNIARLGLKRPVTVARADSRDGEPRYDLVCGQGRLEAYRALGQELIHAIVIEGPRDILLLKSLVENLARRRHSTVELVRGIKLLKERGYTPSEIARKTDLDVSYVRGLLQLLDRGEERLLQAVEAGQLPVSIAITIATADDRTIQRVLQEAYERNDLRGKALLRARRLIETRRARGKGCRNGSRKTYERPISTEKLLKTFQQEAARQRLVVQKAKVCETRLLFAVSALKQMFQDEHFVTLLRAEGLDSLPQYLAEQINCQRSAS